MPWGRVLQGRVQQRFAFTWGDFDNRYHSSFGDSKLDSRRATFRAQTDLAASPSTGLSFGIEALGERARSTYVVGEQGQETPIERRNIGTFVEVRQDLGPRATITAGVRAEHITRDALEGDPNGFTPRPTFAADDVTSVNPRVAALRGAVAGRARQRAHAAARQRRHRHPPARRVRDRLHRQPFAEAGAQPERGPRRQPDADEPRDRRRHVVLQPLRGPDRGDRIVHRRQPLHDRQHREREGERARAGRCRRADRTGSRRGRRTRSCPPRSWPSIDPATRRRRSTSAIR